MKPRADGRYQATKRVSGQKLFGYGSTPEEAKADLARKLLDQSAAAEITLSTNPTLHELAKAVWWPRIERNTPRTRERYTSSYVRHIRPALGHMVAKSIRPSDVQRFANSLSEKAISPNGRARTAKRTMDPTGVRYVVGVLRSVLRAIEDEGLIDRNPARSVVLPKKKAKRERYLSPADAATILEELRGHPLLLPVFLAMVLGLRRSEIAALTWDDLDRTRQELRITKQAGRRLGDPPQSLKSTASNRTLPLPASFVAFIDAHGDLDAPTICTRAGKAWLPDTITDEWTAWTGKPKGWTFHDLRHGAAGLIAAATGNVLAVKSVLGHGSVDMTTIYTAESASRMDSAMQAIETALFGRRGSS